MTEIMLEITGMLHVKRWPGLMLTKNKKIKERSSRDMSCKANERKSALLTENKRQE